MTVQFFDYLNTTNLEIAGKKKKGMEEKKEGGSALSK
jgi:hypothetical protein